MATPEPTADRIGIRELRQNASRYVALAKAGKRVPVTLPAWVGSTAQDAWKEAAMRWANHGAANGRSRAASGAAQLASRVTECQPVAPSGTGSARFSVWV